MMRRIIQIVEADGWSAVLATRIPAGQVILRQKPLACWALFEDHDEVGTWSDVVGLTAEDDVEACDLEDGFVGYLHDGDDIEQWRARAERMLAVEPLSRELRTLRIPVPAD